jgi:hypothetical protein
MLCPERNPMKFMNFVRKSMLWILMTPYAILGTGIMSNQVVLQANHDTFPVLVNPIKLSGILPDGVTITPGQSQAIDEVHVTMTSQTHLNFLADVFDLGAIYSIGDFTIMLGEWMLTFTPFIWGALVIRKLTEEKESE